jgi:type II secretory pathway component GspD/PulD (secretin)
MDARDAAEALRKIVPDSWGVDDIRADVAHNTLLIRADPEAVLQIRALLAPVPDPPTETVVVVYLENATAAQLQPAVQAAAPQGIVAIADTPTNSIVLAGPLGWDPEPMRSVIRNVDRSSSASGPPTSAGGRRR